MLTGVRVLDLSRVLAGPWASQTLADLGAEVIKVERPGRGDETRAWGPPFHHGPDDERGPAAYYLACNRGKRSVTIDLGHEEGQGLVRKLAAKSDILLENFRPGGLARFGLDYESLKTVHPGLIYCAISGFGQTGPYRDRAGYDLLVQAMGGLMSITGTESEPAKAGVALTDILTGLYATVGCLAALRDREQSGQGRYIDLSLMDVQVATLANQAMNYLVGGQVPGRMGSAHPNIVPYQAFATADGEMVICVGNDDQFRRLCQVLDEPGLADAPAYRHNADRVANREKLIPRLADILAGRSRVEWLQRLEAAGVPAGPVNDMATVFNDPQVRHRGMQSEISHPRFGTIPSITNPLGSGFNQAGEAPPPVLGQDTDAVLSELVNLDDDALAALRSRGVIG